MLPCASPEQTKIIFDACRRKEAFVSRKRDKQTERLLQQVWRASFEQLQEAVAEHVEQNRKIFLKHGSDGRLLDGLFEANVTLYSELDIYVEIEIRCQEIVILAAHNHTTNPLPQ